MTNTKPFPYPAETVHALQSCAIYRTVEMFSAMSVDCERMAIAATHASELPIGQVIPTLVCARVSMAAWAALSCADMIPAAFDPVEFGKVAERIARDAQLHYAADIEAMGKPQQ